MHKYLLLILVAIIAGCSDKYKHIPEDQFIGKWELHGRSMFEGIIIDISRNEKGDLSGKVEKLNNNKYVQLFAETGDTWILSISRSSKFQFRITEKKIGKELFSLYGLSGSSEYKAEFIDKNTVGIATGNSDPAQATVIYKRIE